MMWIQDNDDWKQTEKITSVIKKYVLALTFQRGRTNTQIFKKMYWSMKWIQGNDLFIKNKKKSTYLNKIRKKS